MDEGLGFGRRNLIDKVIEHNWKDGKIVFNKNELLFIIQEMLEEEGKQYLEHNKRKGSPFTVMRNFAKYLLYRNLANYDSMVLIDGQKGTGKSSAAIMLCREWCKLLGIRFDPKRHIAYNNADVMNKIDMLNNFEPLICVGQNSRVRIKKEGVEKSIEIKKLVDMKDYEVLSYNKDKDIFEYKKPEKTIFTKRDKIYTLELENGLKLNATGNHLILTKNGYKRMDELGDSDEVILSTKKCVTCGKEYFNKQWDGKTCSKECFRLWKNKNAWGKLHREESRQKGRKRYNKRFKEDLKFRLKHNLITRLPKEIIRARLFKGIDRFERTFNCTIQFFIKYIESKFEEGMSWDNYGHGKGKWCIDHYYPVRLINLATLENAKEICNYKNIRPLWSIKNSKFCSFTEGK